VPPDWADGGQEAGLEKGDRDAEAGREAGDLRGRLMGMKTFRPTSPGRRQMTVLTAEELSPVKPEKRLLEYIKGTGGRNNQGRISVRHHGGGHKRLYRRIDFKRDKAGIPARVHAIEYDPNRSARIALLHYADGEMRKVLVACQATVGQVGNTDHENITIGKAGRVRWKGRRPHVRGVAMNPVDHPHGGGEGKSGAGNPHPVSPWGQKAKGYKTRRTKRTGKFIIARRKT